MTEQETILYDRQKELELNVPKTASVIGVGGIGTWVAILLGMSGVGELEISDSDTVDMSNLNRLPYGPHTTGMDKTGALTAHLKDIRPDIRIRMRESAANFDRTDFAFICTDALQSKLEYAAVAERKGKKFAILGYDGNRISLSVNRIPVVWDFDRDGYRVVPSWVVPPVMVASAAVYIALMHQDSEYSFDGSIEELLGL